MTDMFLPMDKVGDVLATYIDQEIVPQSLGFQKLIAAMVGITVVKNTEATIGQYKEFMRMLDILDDKDRIDIDAARALARASFGKTGSITALGVTFNEDDVDTLYALAKKHASST